MSFAVRPSNKHARFFFCRAANQRGSWPPHSWGFFLDHTQRRTTVGRTSLDEWSARRKDLYLTTHNTQQTNIHAPGGIRTHDLNRQACKIDYWNNYVIPRSRSPVENGLVSTKLRTLLPFHNHPSLATILSQTNPFHAHLF
jgi:hypothetical protein